MIPHRGRARVPLGLVLIALGIAFGVLAYLVGRSDDEAGARSTGAPKGMLVIQATGDVSLDPSYIPLAPGLGLARRRPRVRGRADPAPATP
jgi:hypothetical protein